MIDGTVIGLTPVRELREEWQPTLVNLCKHFDRFGLDNSHERTYRNNEPRYTSFKSLIQDALVRTGQAYLGEDAFVQLIEHIGYSNYAEEGRVHWRSLRNTQALLV